jgi:hypothetical protein
LCCDVIGNYLRGSNWRCGYLLNLLGLNLFEFGVGNLAPLFGRTAIKFEEL